MPVTGSLATVALCCGYLAGCGEVAPPPDPIPIGLLLSYSGDAAADSINSERALLLALEEVNAAGGLRGHPLRVVARNTRTDADRTLQATRELIAAGAPVIVGPDTLDLVKMVRPLTEDRTLMLPSFSTASMLNKPAAWLVMGAGPVNMACELMAEAAQDGRTYPIVISNATGYNTRLAWELTNGYGLPKFVLPSDEITAAVVRPLAQSQADAFVLAAFPASATALVQTLLALGALREPSRWYLGPTLHTPAFREFLPHGVLEGARGVAPGAGATAAAFRLRFAARWHASPLDDAYPFYDAGAIAALALGRALTWDGAIPTGTDLAGQIVKVTNPGGTAITWDQLGRGLALLEQHQEVQYVGVSGASTFDASGQTPTARASWFSLGPAGFEARAHESQCR